ncbi:hypothetical protein SVIO_059740 [Streptomyces violaceusniger]|uniref:Uncharacterized protein n=1 Tax=Streptomyces violaceusniger TaxID=68280 RepID=A0A4D4L177_STRVO|nr:hypothetical protein SVIO_059740 [Streptomyces violaceusniger]
MGVTELGEAVAPELCEAGVSELWDAVVVPELWEPGASELWDSAPSECSVPSECWDMVASALWEPVVWSSPSCVADATPGVSAMVNAAAAMASLPRMCVFPSSRAPGRDRHREGVTRRGDE